MLKTELCGFLLFAPSKLTFVRNHYPVPEQFDWLHILMEVCV